jgi:hypothetical protein
MALYEQTTRATYLSIWDGSIVQKSKEPREGYERHEKDGRVSYVKRYPGFDGFIDDIIWFDREIEGGKRIKGWNLVVSDKGDVYQLSMPLNSAATNVFMNVAGNIDFEQKVSFSAWKDREGKTAFLLRQPDRTGETVKRCHTKDHPNGMPQAKYSERRKEWDFTEVEDFLLEKMESKVIPKCKAAAAGRTPDYTGDNGFDNDTLGMERETPFNEPLQDSEIPF